MTGPDTATLEVGCGTARNLIKLGKRSSTGALYGLDASHEMLETATSSIASAALPYNNNPPIMLRQGLAEELDGVKMFGHAAHPVAAPFLSAGHFFVSAAFLPYKMGVELPWECVYPLGYYRPGDCAPWTVPAPAMSLRGAALEAAALTGAYFILPFPGPGF